MELKPAGPRWRHWVSYSNLDTYLPNESDEFPGPVLLTARSPFSATMYKVFFTATLPCYSRDIQRNPHQPYRLLSERSRRI